MRNSRTLMFVLALLTLLAVSTSSQAQYCCAPTGFAPIPQPFYAPRPFCGAPQPYFAPQPAPAFRCCQPGGTVPTTVTTPAATATTTTTVAGCTPYGVSTVGAPVITTGGIPCYQPAGIRIPCGTAVHPGHIRVCAPSPVSVVAPPQMPTTTTCMPRFLPCAPRYYHPAPISCLPGCGVPVIR